MSLLRLPSFSSLSGVLLTILSLSVLINYGYGDDESLSKAEEPNTATVWPPWSTSRDPWIPTSDWTTHGPACPDFFEYIGGHCLFVNPFVEGTWMEMAYFCHELGSELLVIDDLGFYTDLLHFIKSQGIHNHDYWIGANDTLIEGTWEWVDGSPVPSGSPFWAYFATSCYTPQEYDMEPRGGNSQNCLYLDSARYLLFDDQSCEAKMNVICQLM